MYLVDTSVLPAGAPTKAVATPALMHWMASNSPSLFLSVITIGEIEGGIAKCRRQGAHRKAERLTDWLAAVLHFYGERVLPIDVETARHIGRLGDVALAQGLAPGLANLAVAATAQRHGWTVLTRNLRHIRPMGVRAHDPFAALPDDIP